MLGICASGWWSDVVGYGCVSLRCQGLARLRSVDGLISCGFKLRALMG